MHTSDKLQISAATAIVAGLLIAWNVDRIEIADKIQITGIVVSLLLSGFALWKSSQDSLGQQELDERIASAIEKQTRTMSKELETTREIAEAATKHASVAEEHARQAEKHAATTEKQHSFEVKMKQLEQLTTVREQQRLMINSTDRMLDSVPEPNNLMPHPFWEMRKTVMRIEKDREYTPPLHKQYMEEIEWRITEALEQSKNRASYLTAIIAELEKYREGHCCKLQKVQNEIRQIRNEYNMFDS